jgi:hypothetical protein
VIVVALADSDSYLKWGAATLDHVVPDAERHLFVVANPVMPSPGQSVTAVAATSWAGAEIEVLSADAAVDLVSGLDADAVLVAMRGPTAAVLLGMLAELPRRPVLFSGVPGIAMPARRKALVYRSQADLVLIHSHQEREAFLKLDRAEGMNHRFALTTLPFLDRRPGTGGDIVFAAQALVPASQAERKHLAGRLVDCAVANPDRRVVLKTRVRAGERQTHDERWPLDSLLPSHTPPNLVVHDGPMGTVLDHAAALVSVSSTALIEAIARGIPALVLGDYGVGDEQLNGVFIGSGLVGTTDDLVEGRFRLADAEWSRRNYLHDESENDAASALRERVAARRSRGLPVRLSTRAATGGALRHAWNRRTALGRHDGRALGVLAMAVGVPARAVVRIAGRWRSARHSQR